MFNFLVIIDQRKFWLNNYDKFDQKIMVNWLENNIAKLMIYKKLINNY